MYTVIYPCHITFWTLWNIKIRFKNILTKYWNLHAPIKFCSQIPYNMVLIYLGLKIWSHKTFNPPPPFSSRIWKSGVQCFKKNSHKGYENQRGSKFNSDNNSKSLYNMMWKSEGRTIFCNHNISKRLWKSEVGGSKYFTETSSSLVGFWKQMGVQNISVIIFWNLSPIGYENQSIGSILLKPHYTCILRKYQTNKLLISQYPDKSLHLNMYRNKSS